MSWKVLEQRNNETTCVFRKNNIVATQVGHGFGGGWVCEASVLSR